MLIAALLVLTSDPTISYESTGTAVSKVIQSLAEQSGQKLGCEEKVASEPIFLAVKDRPLEECLDKIASVCCAEWKEEEGRRVLRRSSALLSRIKAEDQRLIQETISRFLADETKRLETIQPQDDAGLKELLRRGWGQTQEEMTKNYRAATGESAAYRAVIAYASRIGAKQLSAIPVGARRVYSDLPNQAQTLLPDKGELKKVSRWASRMSEFIPSQHRYSTGAFGFLTIGTGRFDTYRRSLFIARRQSNLAFDFEFRMLDGSGNLIAHGTWSLPDHFPLAVAPGARGEGKEVKLTVDQKHLLKVMDDIGVQEGGGMAQPIRFADGTESNASYVVTFAEMNSSPEDYWVSHITSRPDEFDPLSYYVGPLFLQCAALQGVSVIGTLSDSSIEGLARRAPVYGKDSYFLQAVETGVYGVPHGVIETKDGWMIVRPRFPSLSLAGRLKRGPMAQFIREANEGRATLQAACRYYAANPIRIGYFLRFEPILTHGAKNADRLALDDLLTSGLEVFEAMGTASRPIGPGRGVFGDLSPKARELLNRMAESKAKDNGFERGVRSGLDFSDHFPNGIPLDTPCETRVTEQLAVKAATQTGDVRWFSLASLAWAESKTTLIGEGAYRPRPWSSYIAGKCRVITLTVDSNSKVLDSPRRVVVTAVEYLSLPEATPGSRKDLPKEYLSKLEEAKKHF